MFVIDISNFKNNISSLVNFVIKSYGSITIKTKKGNVVYYLKKNIKALKRQYICFQKVIR